MLACLKTGIGKTEMTDIPIPEPGSDQMVVKMSMTTICGTDMHFLDELPNEALAPFFPGVVLPEGMLQGHEAVGVVHSTGEGVTSFEVGDRVMAACITSCGRCSECMHGDYGVCTGDGPYGRPLFGCQAEYYLVPNAEVSSVKVPDEVSDEEAILASDILSTGLGAVERGEAGYGDSIAIFAQGPVGLCATLGARIRGCGLIVAIDSIPERLEFAKKFGANVVINPSEEDPVAKIMGLTNNNGVDVAIEAVGTQATFESATRVVRRGGTVSSVGVYNMTPMLQLPTLIPSFNHRRIVTTFCPSGRERMRRMLDMIRYGSLELDRLYTHRMSLSECSKAYDLFRSKEDGVLKIAITP
jgi:2-desacetyl-2-hydroxyethyl bacteriochlorophyllide A dehydrogenase